MNIKNNLPLIYIISCLMWGRFFIPVLALFYIASQVPLEQFTIIMAIFSLVILVLEVPSGVIADLLGKKKTLLIGRLGFMIEVFILAFYNGFWPVLIAKIISGMAFALTSGTTDAFLYDTLKRIGRVKEHKKISGNLFMVVNISMAFTFIIGSFLFSINNKLPAILSLPFLTMGFILTFFVVEPYKSKRKISIKNSFLQLKEGLVYVAKHIYVKYLIYFSLPIATITIILLSTSSAYLEKVLIPISLIGIVAFIASMITAASSKMAHKFEEKIGDRKSLLLIEIVTFLGIFLMALMTPYIGAVFYLLIALASGLFLVLVNHYVNVHIPTSHRATILSIKNLTTNLGLFMFFPFVGYITKVKSMGVSFFFFRIIVRNLFNHIRTIFKKTGVQTY